MSNSTFFIPIVFHQVHHSKWLTYSYRYRKAPQNPFPIPYEDCLNSTLEFVKQAGTYNVDPNRIAIAGDSAGIFVVCVQYFAKIKNLSIGFVIPIHCCRSIYG